MPRTLQKQVDNVARLGMFRDMAQPEPSPLIRKSDFIVDVIVVAAFFALMFWLLRSHVPSNDPKMVALWGGLGAACMSGVFWLAVSMLRVVARYQAQLRRKR